MISSVDLAYLEVRVTLAKDWVSVGCGTSEPYAPADCISLQNPLPLSTRYALNNC